MSTLALNPTPPDFLNTPLSPVQPPVPIKTCIFVRDNRNIFPDFQDTRNTAVTRAPPGACDFEVSSPSGL